MASFVTENEYALEWIPEKDYVSGTEIEIRQGSLRAFLDWHFVHWATPDGDVTYRWKTQYTPSEMRTNPHRILVRIRFQYGVRKNIPVHIMCRAIPSHWAGISAVLSVWVLDRIGPSGTVIADTEARRETGASCELITHSGPVGRFLVYSRPYVAKGETVRTVLLPTDRFGNPTKFRTPAQITIRWNGDEIERKVAGPSRVELPFPTSEVARAEVFVPVDALAPIETILTGHRDGGTYVLRGNPVWSGDFGGVIPAFGEFHWHTDISGDGWRTIRQALSAARDDLNFDFAAPADHNPGSDAWDETVAALEDFDEEGAFATFFGWEASSDRGHENLYFTDPDHPMVCHGSAGYSGGRPERFPEELDRIPDFLRIPHHTNAVAETRDMDTDVPFWHEYPWNRPSETVRLAEIIQIRGNQERNVYSDVWRGWHQHHGASLQDALAQGYEIGFVGGTDNHCGWPGRGFAMDEIDAYTLPPYTMILTGVWTRAISRNEVFNALSARHTWAVCDTRAIVRFSVNGAFAGDVLTVDRGAPVSASIRISAEDSLASVEIVSEGETCWISSFVEEDIGVTVELGNADTNTHFYLRALERKGGLMYSSPVFVRVC